MKISKEIEKVSGLVEKLLKEDKKYRDSDKKLSAKIWAVQFGGIPKLKDISAFDFLCEYVKDKSFLCSQESIGRARRKLQELNPELRGKKYKKKQSEQTDVRHVLGYKK